MHRFDQPLAPADVDAILAYAADRLSLDPVPLDGPLDEQELRDEAGVTVTPAGLGAARALDVFADVLAPSCLSTDHPRYLSFIPCAPTQEAAAFDVVVGASSIYGGSWLEGSGAVHAENETLRWIADLAGLPRQAGGVVRPRRHHREPVRARRRPAYRSAQRPGGRLGRPALAGRHDLRRPLLDPVGLRRHGRPADDRLRRRPLAADRRQPPRTLEDNDPKTFFAVVATAGTTNFGIVDDLASRGRGLRELGIWFHVDGAYGGAALAAPSARHLFDGVERADSFIVDPHKWLFAPFDCCALIYREPALARAAHTQHAGYLDVLTDATDWNPTDYSVGLTRRARGLPLWFSLAVHGTEAYARAVERTLEVARFAEAEIGRRERLELLRERDLSVMVFRRIGWAREDYQAWSDRLLADEFAFVVPTTHEGETVTRFAIVNPTTTEDDILAILDTMS